MKLDLDAIGEYLEAMQRLRPADTFFWRVPELSVYVRKLPPPVVLALVAIARKAQALAASPWPAGSVEREPLERELVAELERHGL